MEKRGIKIKEDRYECSELEFGMVFHAVYNYYDFENLEKKTNLTHEERIILEGYKDEMEFQKQMLKEGYSTYIIYPLKLDETLVSREEYNNILEKLRKINKEIKRKKLLKRQQKLLERKCQYVEMLKREILKQ